MSGVNSKLQKQLLATKGLKCEEFLKLITLIMHIEVENIKSKNYSSSTHYETFPEYCSTTSPFKTDDKILNKKSTFESQILAIGV